MRSALIKGLTIDKDRRDYVDNGIPASRPKFMWFLYRKHSQDFMKANLLFVLCLLPLFMCFTVLPGIFQNLAIGDNTYNFLGNIGFGFPGTIDSLAALKLAIYDKYIYLMLCFVGAILIMSIGASGLFYVCRNIAWRKSEKIKVFREFFKGIKLYFFKYLLMFVLIGAVFFGTAMLFLWHFGLMALGTANAGSWIAIVLACIFDLYFVAVVMEMLPMICAYKFKFFVALKNSCILAIMLFPINIIVIALMALPFLLGMIQTMIMLLIALLFIMFGGTFYCFVITSFAHYTFDLTINQLYEQGLKTNRNKKKKNTNPSAPKTNVKKAPKVKKFTVESFENSNPNTIVMNKEDGVEEKSEMNITVVNDSSATKTVKKDKAIAEEKENVKKVVTKSQYGKYKSKKVK